MEILFHADDYAVSLHASKQMISCIKEGHVQSISIMPNMSCFEDSLKLLGEVISQVKISVHLNIMEGFSVSDPKRIPLLVDEKGLFCISWGKLLIYSLIKPKALKEQLKTEWKAQIEKVQREMPQGYKLRIDSHQHPHMIPAAFQAVTELINEEGYETEYVRVASEKIWPFLKHGSLFRTYSFANIIKNILLNLFGVYNKHLLKKCGHIQYYDFMGLIFSGKMDEKRVSIVLPDILMKTKEGIEVLFHPGYMKKEEWNEEYNKEEFNRFHFSRCRTIEEAAVKSGLYERIKDAAKTAS